MTALQVATANDWEELSDELAEHMEESPGQRRMSIQVYSTTLLTATCKRHPCLQVPFTLHLPSADIHSVHCAFVGMDKSNFRLPCIVQLLAWISC